MIFSEMGGQKAIKFKPNKIIFLMTKQAKNII